MLPPYRPQHKAICFFQKKSPRHFVAAVSYLQSAKPEGGFTKTCAGFSLVGKTRLLMLEFKTERLPSRGIKAVYTGSVWFA
jgi:hypothetical protein